MRAINNAIKHAVVGLALAMCAVYFLALLFKQWATGMQP